MMFHFLYRITLTESYLGPADSAAVVSMAVSPFSSGASAGTMVPSLFNFTGGRRRLASAATAARRVTSNRDPSVPAVEAYSRSVLREREEGVVEYAGVIGWAGLEDNGNLYLSIESI